MRYAYAWQQITCGVKMFSLAPAAVNTLGLPGRIWTSHAAILSWSPWACSTMQARYEMGRSQETADRDIAGSGDGERFNGR
jgi:hypothetical protein